MASNINPYNIDGTYPVAGQDNDSQGFRDNFTNIANNFSTAATEITDLQSKALLKSSLTGGTLNNNMGGSSLSNLLLTGAGYTLNNQGTLTGAVTLDFSTGNVQKVTTGGAITLSFTNWPITGSYARIVLWLVVSDTGHTVTVSTTSPGVTGGLTEIAGASSSGVITFDEAGTYMLEFTTLDAGNNIYINDINRNATSLRGSNLYYNPDLSSTLLVGYGAGKNTALTLELGQDVVSAAGSYNSVSVGNLTLANITSPATNIGGLAGYSITSARGNLSAASYTPVQSNDLLGYVNSITYTGSSGSANVFQQVSSIGFYATGSNVTYGLGGNIAFYTHKDGGNGTTNGLNQAVGIENDQSTKFFGNIITTQRTPTGPTATGTAGQIAVDANYIYVCTATNTWKRVAISSSGW